MAGMGTRMVPKIARRVAHLGPQPILRLRFPNGPLIGIMRCMCSCADALVDKV